MVKLGKSRLCCEGEGDAVHERHADIGEHQIERPVRLRQPIQSVTAIRRRHDGMTVNFQAPLQETTYRLFVINKENSRHQLFVSAGPPRLTLLLSPYVKGCFASNNT